MSRVVVFDLDNKAVGEFNSIVERGYLLYGHAGISGEASTTVLIDDNRAERTWLNFGRAALVESPSLPPWMGIIDPPWGALAPVSLTLYSAEYLLALRTPDVQRKLTGDAAQIITQMVGEANNQEDLFVRIGFTDSDNQPREETLTQKPVWEQIRAFCERTKTELTLRPVRENDRLYLYLDLASASGMDTGYLLHDGETANFIIHDAKVTGRLTNRILGVSSQSSSQSRLNAGPFLDTESAGQYRLRSEVLQSRDVTQITTLEKNTLAALNASARPRLSLSGSVQLSDNEAAMNLRLGNWFTVHASRLYLPGGVRGWRGKMRIIKFFVSEKSGTANITMEAYL